MHTSRTLRSRFAATALAVATVTTGLATLTAAPAQATPAACSSVFVYGSRGSGQDGSTTLKAPGFIVPAGYDDQAAAYAVALQQKAKKGTKFLFASNPFPAVRVDNPWNTISDAYKNSVAKGAANIRTYVAAVRKSCGSAKVVLIGYSQGAQATHDALATMPAADLKLIAAVELAADPNREVADPTPTAQRLSVKGEKATGNGVMWRSSTKRIPASLKGKVLSTCHSLDPVCSFTVANTKLAGDWLTFAFHTDPYKLSSQASEAGAWLAQAAKVS